ncbi:MAG: transcriptional repressor LexA [Spirochaetales bacterium]|jgi:repressor LexA|nr:transcriptional repressor LexA [Spirochaetales bacterium]
MKDLTGPQKAVLLFIAEFIKTRKYPPTTREIAARFGFSSNGAHFHLKALAEKGYITRNFNRARAIEIVKLPGAQALVPEKNPESPEQKIIDMPFLVYDDLPSPEASIDVAFIPILGPVSAGQPIYVEENTEGYLALPSDSFQREKYFALRIEGHSMTGAGILDGDIALFVKSETARNGDLVAALTEEGGVTIKRFFKEANRIRLKAENPKYPDIYCREPRIQGILKCITRNYD